MRASTCQEGMVGRKDLFILLVFITTDDRRGWGGMAAQEGRPGGSVRRWCRSSVRCQPRTRTRTPHPAPRPGGAASPAHNKLSVPTFPLPPAGERGAPGSGPGGPRLPVRRTGGTGTVRRRRRGSAAGRLWGRGLTLSFLPPLAPPLLPSSSGGGEGGRLLGQE